LVRRQVLTIFGLADGDIRCRKVGQNRGAGHGGKTGRRYRHPDVFAQLDKEREAGDAFCLKEEIGAEGDSLLSAQGDGSRQGLFRRAELTALVKLPVIGEIGFDGDPSDTSPVKNDATVEKPIVGLKGGAHDEDQVQVPGGGNQGIQPLPDGYEKGILVKQILVGISGKAQFWKEGEKGLVGDGLLRQREGLGDIESRIGDANLRNADGHADEPVVVEVEKGVHGDST